MLDSWVWLGATEGLGASCSVPLLRTTGAMTHAYQGFQSNLHAEGITHRDAKAAAPSPKVTG